jgi:pimeloyl-ACP methyl ester carboxylesterase
VPAAPPLLALEESGAGEPLVLIHGLATTRLIWRRVAPILDRRRLVVCIDAPGFGASPPAGRGFDLPAVAARVADGLAAAGIAEPFDLAGHSMGGAIALVLAAQRPDSVRRLVLVAPAGLRPIPGVAAAAFGATGAPLIALRRAAAPLTRSAWGRRLLLATGTVDGALISATDARAMVCASRRATRVRQALATVAAADLRPLLSLISAPVGLLWGAEDRIIPPAGADQILARRPDALVRLVPAAGHIAMMERPEAFAGALDGLLDDLLDVPPPGRASLRAR